MSDSAPSRRRNTILRWSLLVLVAVLGVGVIYLTSGDGAAGIAADSSGDGAAHAGGRSGDGASIRTPVRVVEPSYGTLERTFTVSGYVESDRVVTVTPKVQGTLEELLVDLGDPVEQGRRIAEIDDSQYRLELRQAEANFAAAESAFLRTEELFEGDATSRQNYEQARSQYQAAEAQLELARLQMSYTSLQAPVGGTVIQRHTAAGSVVGTTSPIVTIADLDDLVVQAKIPEQHFLAFSENPEEMPVEVALPSLEGRSIEGRIRTVSPYVSPSSRNFDVVVDLTEDGFALRPGMFVEITFVLARRDEVYSLPFEALADDGRLWYLRGDGTVTAADIDPEFTSATAFVVPEEWAGRRVVIEGQNFLTEGQSVTVVGETGQP